MSCWSVISFDFFAGQIARALQWECSFSSEKSNELTDQQDVFALTAHLLSIRPTISRKMLIDNKIEARIATGNPTGNECCYAFASHALNVSCSFGQSARWIESRCVVRYITCDFSVCPSNLLSVTMSSVVNLYYMNFSWNYLVELVL